MHIADAPQYENAVREHELLLRSAGITSPIQLAHLNDDFDCIDLTNNKLSRITDDFPRLPRLKILFLSHNRISSIDPAIADSFPGLESLSLAYNSISDFEALQFLRNTPQLTHLCVEGNPITRLADYRSTILRLQPHIRFLDFKRVTESERTAGSAKEPRTAAGALRKAELLAKLELAVSIDEIDAIEKELAELSGK